MRAYGARIAAVVAVAALASGACGDDDDGGGAAAPTSAPTGAPTATTGAPPTTSRPAAAVQLADDAGVGAKILVDAQGRTLYVFDNDTTPGRSTCTGDCATAWPPAVVDGTPSYGTGLDSSMFSLITRGDGARQLAVRDKPLYRYAGDAAPGDTNGNGLAGVWYVVGEDGEKIDRD